MLFAFAKAYSQQTPSVQDSLNTSSKVVESLDKSVQNTKDTIVEKPIKKSPKEFIREFFVYFHARDTTAMKEMMVRDASVKSLVISNTKGRQLIHADQKVFLSGIASIPDTLLFEERLIEVKVLNSVDIAVVNTSYEFYVNEGFTHNGTNVFTLVFIDDKWKIASIVDTRYYP